MLTFEVPLIRVRLGNRVEFAEPGVPPHPNRVLPMARCLALGHRIVRAVESGEVRDFSEAAKRMGVSRPRVSMLVALTFLYPRLQEAILAGTDDGKGFRTLLRMAREDAWKDQESLAKVGRHAERDRGRTSRVLNPPGDFDPESRPKTSQREPTQAV